MTASWGGLGWLWNKPVAFIFVRPERYTHDFLERSDKVTLSFFPESCRKALQICGSKSGRDCDKVKEAGLTPVALGDGSMTFGQARLTLACRKLLKTDMEPDGQGTSDGVAARGFVNGRGPRQRRGRDSTDRCVPVRSPLSAGSTDLIYYKVEKKSKVPKSPSQRSGDLNYPSLDKIEDNVPKSVSG